MNHLLCTNYYGPSVMDPSILEPMSLWQFFKLSFVFILFDSDRDEDKKTEPEFFSTVRPEEIPDVPTHKFLLRGSPPKKEGDEPDKGQG